MITQETNEYLLTRDSTYTEYIQILNDNVNIDFTDYTNISMDIRRGNKPTGELIYTANISNNSILILGDNITLFIEIGADITKDMVPGIYYRELLLEDGVKKYRPFWGKIKVRENITDQ